MTALPKISVVIPVYKKADMVLRNLVHNRPFLTNYEVLLVDDASGDDLPEKMRAIVPEATVLESKTNKGFAPTINKGIRASHGDYIILLGSDVLLMNDFPASLTEPFEKDINLFAITFKQRERDGTSIGKNRMYFTKGLPNHEKTDDLTHGKNAWADGGASIVRKDYLNALGGFNELYAPFYWEDNDLSYRAYSRGWHVNFDPDIFVEHHHESTIGTFYDKKRITIIASRNQFIFTWANITDFNLFIQHLLWLPYYLIVFGIKGDRALVVGFWRAIMKLPAILKSRKLKKRAQKVSDTDIFKLFQV